MQYTKYSPSKLLQPYVECYFVWKSDNLRYPLLIDSPPSGYAAVVFNFAGAYKAISKNGQTQINSGSFVIGQTLCNYQLEVSEHIDQIGIVFKPTGVYKILDIPGFEIADCRYALADVSASMANLEDQLMGSPLDQDRITLLDKTLAAKMIAKDLSVDCIDQAANYIVDQKGDVKISEVLEQTYMSRRKFERHFFKNVGLSPKYYARLRRYGFTCSLIAGKREADWSRILHNGGYYDQSHFIRDFKEFSGQSPTDYLQHNQELAHKLTD